VCIPQQIYVRQPFEFKQVIFLFWAQKGVRIKRIYHSNVWG